jgi:hypothetical protein
MRFAESACQGLSFWRAQRGGTCCPIPGHKRLASSPCAGNSYGSFVGDAWRAKASFAAADPPPYDQLNQQCPHKQQRAIVCPEGNTSTTDATEEHGPAGHREVEERSRSRAKRRQQVTAPDDALNQGRAGGLVLFCGSAGSDWRRRFAHRLALGARPADISPAI